MSNREVSLIIKAKDQATKNLEQVSGAVDALTASSADLAKTTDASGKKLGQLGAAAAKLKSLELVGATLEDITFQIEKSNVALTTQRTSFERVSKDVAEYSRLLINATGKLQTLRNTPPSSDASKKDLRTYASDVKKVESEISKLTTSLERARDAQGEQSRNLRTSTANIDAMNTMAQKLRGSLDADGNSAAKLAEQLQKVARARAEIAAKRAFEAAPRTQAPQALSADPSAQVRTIRADYQAAIVTLSALQAQFRAAKSPTIEMGTALGEQRARVIALHSAYETLRTQAAQRISQDRELAERTRQNSEMLRRAADQRARDAREAESQAGLQANAERIRADAMRRSALEMERLHREAIQMNREFDRTRESTRNVNSLTEALRRLAGGTNTSLSLFQRMRGQILAVGASYVGVFGAANLVSGIFDAQRQMDQIMGKFAVAFQGDEQKAATEFEFTKQVANELGLDLRSLADDYSKLAIATAGTNLAGKKTRDIFLAVAQAARVQNLSAEDTQGVMKALTQIVSKGVVMSEELKDQIGDRLPGAMRTMAEGTKLTTKQLVKLMEQGDLSAESLINFARRLSEINAGGVKSASERAAASLERVKNAWFELQIALGQSGFMDAVGVSLEEMAKALRDPAVIAAIKEFGASLAYWTRTIVAFVKAHPEEVLIAIKTLALALGAQIVVGGLLNFGEALFRIHDLFKKLQPLLVKAGLPGLVLAIASALGTLYAILSEDESDKVAAGAKELARAYDDLGNSAQQARMKASWADEIKLATAEAVKLRKEIEKMPEAPIAASTMGVGGGISSVAVGKAAKRKQLETIERKIAIREKALSDLINKETETSVSSSGSAGSGNVIDRPEDFVASDNGKARDSLMKKLAEQIKDAKLKFAQLLAKDTQLSIDDALKLEKDAIALKYEEIYKTIEELGLSRTGIEGQVVEQLIKQEQLLAEQKAEAEKLKESAKARNKAEADANELMSYRQQIQERILYLQKQGRPTGEIDKLKASLDGIDVSLKAAIESAIKLNEALGTPEGDATAARFRMLYDSLGDIKDRMKLSAEEIDQAFLDLSVGALMDFGEAIGKIVSEGGGLSDVFSAAKDAFRSFAADFLKRIAQMILQQAILSAMGGTGQPGGIGATIVKAVAGLKFHDGGTIGSGGSPTLMSPGWFNNAKRYHTGGVVGLKPNEVPIIAEKGEEVLTRQDARHSANGGGSSPVQVKVINSIDSVSVINEALSTSVGQKAIVNAIRANKSSVKAALV